MIFSWGNNSTFYRIAAFYSQDSESDSSEMKLQAAFGTWNEIEQPEFWIPENFMLMRIFPKKIEAIVFHLL
jgi:pyridoxine/pyridoxamine 5'-phosphate oxidase